MMDDTELTQEEIEEEKKKIDGMSRYDMAKLWRFARSGHPYFRTDVPLYDYFKKRFDELGGFSPGISKAIGWGEIR